MEWLSEQLDEQNKQKSIIESNVHLLAREYALQHISRCVLSRVLCCWINVSAKPSLVIL